METERERKGEKTENKGKRKFNGGAEKSEARTGKRKIDLSLKDLKGVGKTKNDSML